MVCVTQYGPTRFTPFSRMMSAASTWFDDEAPPEPAMMPVRSFETSASVSPASAMAWLHRDVGEGRRIAHEAQLLAVDLCREIHVGAARHVAAEPHLGIFRDEADARAALAQRRGDGLLAVAQARYDSHAGDDDSAHCDFLLRP